MRDGLLEVNWQGRVLPHLRRPPRRIAKGHTPRRRWCFSSY